MSPDAIALMIAAGAGAVVSAVLTTIVIGGIAHTKATLAAKDAWRAANLYYSHKAAEK